MPNQDYERVEKAIRFLEERYKDQPSLEAVAGSVRLSLFHFQRLFQRWAGVSPKRFLQRLTVENAKKQLEESQTILNAAYDSGLSGPGRLHDLFVSVEAMTPGDYKKGGEGIKIQYGIHPTPFGEALVALTQRGLCGFSFLRDGKVKTALKELKNHWPKADFNENRKATKGIIRQIFKTVSSNSEKKIPVLLKGTPFQLKVWEALLRIPEGSVVSYKTLAKMTGNPQASRAVGTAVGQNTIAYLIPCHRVIRETGVLGNYKWGSARKKAILARENKRG